MAAASVAPELDRSPLGSDSKMASAGRVSSLLLLFFLSFFLSFFLCGWMFGNQNQTKPTKTNGRFGWQNSLPPSLSPSHQAPIPEFNCKFDAGGARFCWFFLFRSIVLVRYSPGFIRIHQMNPVRTQTFQLVPEFGASFRSELNQKSKKLNYFEFGPNKFNWFFPSPPPPPPTPPPPLPPTSKYFSLPFLQLHWSKLGNKSFPRFAVIEILQTGAMELNRVSESD